MYEAIVQNKSVRKNFLFTESLNKELERISSEKHISQNELVNKAVESYLKRFK